LTYSNLSNNNFQVLLFDLDGTLLDSFSTHYEVYEIVFAHFGIQINKERFLETYSPNWYQTYEAFGLPKEDWKAADIFWVEEAEKRNPGLLPRVFETLTKLNNRYTMGLVTSGSKSRVTKDLMRTGIGSFFKTIVTGDDIQAPKPSPESIELALLNLGVQANQVVYIGDAHADYEMAKAAEVHFIGVSSAFASLNSNDPEYSVYPIVDIPDLLGHK
jgi:phosphoglycolate phosphatase/pyrophosphatase PpaX